MEYHSEHQSQPRYSKQYDDNKKQDKQDDDQLDLLC